MNRMMFSFATSYHQFRLLGRLLMMAVFITAPFRSGIVQQRYTKTQFNVSTWYVKTIQTLLVELHDFPRKINIQGVAYTDTHL
jgi:hypothetical protein